MYPLKKHRPFFNSILLLDNFEQEHPKEVLDYFIARHELREVRLLLQQLLEVALTSKNAPFRRPKQRANAARLVRDLEELVEAMHLLQKQQ